MQGIELEGESPSFGVLIVPFEYVTACGVGPLVDWFRNGLQVE